MTNDTKKILILLLLLVCCGTGIAEEEVSREYHIKAAFVYNFIKFIEWPEEKVQDSNEPIIIGVLGESPIYDSLRELNNKKIKNRNVVIKHFESLSGFNLKDESENPSIQNRIQQMKRCLVLFVSTSEKRQYGSLTKILEEKNVLSIDSHADFLLSGGIINFVIKDNKVRFEVNTAAAERSKLKISSKLLRLAINVLEKDEKSVNSEQKNNDKS
jgi:hypothetical protein